MEDNHHHRQEQQQSKFSNNNNGYPSLTSQQQYYQVIHHSPFAFQQSFPAVTTPVQGFSQYAHNSSSGGCNQHLFQAVSLQPQRRPIHRDQENVTCRTSPYITPSPAVLPFSLDLDGKNAGACFIGCAGGHGGGGGGGQGALDARRGRGTAIMVVSKTKKILPPLQSDNLYGSHFQIRMEMINVGIKLPILRNFLKEMKPQASDQLNGNKLFGELQELCRTAAAAAGANKANTNRDDGGLVEKFAAATTTIDAPCLPPTNTSEDSNGDELPSRMADAGDEKKKQKKIRDHEMSSMALFFKVLEYRFKENQENLHKKFMAAVEKVDKKWKEREQVWRQKELERLDQEAALRAKKRSALQREASIVSYLEKITGQNIQLPSNLTESEETRTRLGMRMRVSSVNELSSRSSRGGDDDDLGSLRLMKNRWPPEEVDALIQVRTSLEKKFQGPGYKGPLWDEISKLMASLGYHRTAKRCKEKWEKINKYFKKYKQNSSSNQRFRKKMNKTCMYFDQLDQLYSKSSGLVINVRSNSCSSSSEHLQQQGNSPFSSNGNGLPLKQNEAFVSPGNLMIVADSTIEEQKLGSIIQRIDEGLHPMNYSMEEMEEGGEAVEEGHGNGDDENAAAFD